MTTMRSLLAVALALLAAGCVPNNVRNDAAVFDFGATAPAWPAPLLRGVDVVAPSWLNTSAMQYRLAQADAARRHAYTESRWTAPPAELLEQALRRQALAASGEANATTLGCRLRVDLDELVQTFDSPQSSRVVLAVRANLMSRDERTLASRSFTLERAAASADARGGVAAAAAAVQGLTGELAGWVAGMSAGKSALATRCSE
jgi:cholesterol transport system auxiliary component